MNFKKENWPFYVMLCLMFLCFCKVNPIPFEKDYITAIINGFFILLGIYLTAFLASKELDKKWNKKYYDLRRIHECEKKIYNLKSFLECTTRNSYASKGQPSSCHTLKDEKKNTYNAEVELYRTFIESCDFKYDPIYKYCKSVSGEKPEYCDTLSG